MEAGRLAATDVRGVGAHQMEYPQWFTTGEWITEQTSADAFDDIINGTDLFIIHREVRGYYLQPRLGQQLCTPRIDRILQPKATLQEQGWPYGCIGVECKRSNTNIGPPLSQLLDYSRAAWNMGRGTWIVLQWVFLWPAPDLGGPLLSVFAQNRIGLAIAAKWDALRLKSGQNLATFDRKGGVRIGAGLNGAGTNGRKAGSR
jgi:hypothetical protein